MSVFQFTGKSSSSSGRIDKASMDTDHSFLRLINSKRSSDENLVISFSEKGNVEGILDLIASGVDVSSVQGLNKYTALHHAVRNGNIFLIAELIKQGIPLEARTSLGETALHLAVYSGHLLATEQVSNVLLLTFLCAKDDDGLTLLMYCLC